MKILSSNKHDKILSAAAKVFSQHGFYNSKISQIAREAKVADGTIYLYFKNKDDILISLFEETMDHIISGTAEALDPIDDPVKKIRKFIEFHLHFTQKNPQLANVIQVELRQSSKFMKEYDNQKFREYVNILQETVIDGQELGIIRRDVHPGVVKRAVFGALDEIALHWVLSKKRYSLEDSAKQLADVFTDGLKPEGEK
jgi:TetR/AcrR family transcriptional regulator, fatty acid metabolism regulator protein